jgi:hypothetical protein
MIRLDVEQGTYEWQQARLGIPTASCFDRIITPKTGKLSESCGKYAHQLLAEQITGFPMDAASSSFMERGSLMEHKAVTFYELQRECDTEQVGFVLRDDRRVGCSPDRLVGNDGLLEIKCPSAAVHVGYLLGDQGIGYRAQVQGQLWLCEREWADTLSYHAEMPSALVRVQRDEEFIKALAAAVDQFLAYMDDCKDKLRRYDLFSESDIPPLVVMRGGAA